MSSGIITREDYRVRNNGHLDSLKRLDTKIVRDQVVELLREIILSGRIGAGGRINESQLARDLGVSRIPIREALQQLEQQGLVVTVPRRGKFVINLSEEEMQKINSLRLIVEAEALRLCRANIDSAGLEALDSLVERMEKSGSVPEIEAAALDLEFHRSIWRYSGNELLNKTLESIVIPLFAHRVLWRIKTETLDWAAILPRHHRRLLDFVRNETQDSAEQVMLGHLSYRYSHPDRFSSFALAGKTAKTSAGSPRERKTKTTKTK